MTNKRYSGCRRVVHGRAAVSAGGIGAEEHLLQCGQDQHTTTPARTVVRVWRITALAVGVRQGTMIPNGLPVARKPLSSVTIPIRSGVAGWCAVAAVAALVGRIR